MIKARQRCPVCGTRLNGSIVDREIEFGDGMDVLEQMIGGRGHIENLGRHDFDEEDARAFLEKVEAAREYLREILGMEEEDED
ncbi:MAG: hypothetical protein ACYC6W_11350 [Nitrosotalea sp.]